MQHGLRHTCEQNEGMTGYGWTAYDPRNGGLQSIHDARNNLDLNISFVKDPEGHNHDWRARVSGTPMAALESNVNTAVIFYIALEGETANEQRELDCSGAREALNSERQIECRGRSPSLGGFRFSITDLSSTPRGMAVKSLLVPNDSIWQAKESFLDQLKRDQPTTPTRNEPLLLSNSPGKGNLHFLQLNSQGSFEVDIIYSSVPPSDGSTSDEITRVTEAALKSFESRFDTAYRPNPPFMGRQHEEFSQSLLSNLLGGIGYFYGDSKVDTSSATEYREDEPQFWNKAAEAHARTTPDAEGPFELFSSVPSRPFFPRGFLWDEGFHLEIILDWDMDLALDILCSWFALMDENGWIAREQILGAEARSKVPPEFRVQYPHYANPPTLFGIIAAFLDKLSGKVSYDGYDSYYLSHNEAGRHLLAELYPLLKRHYEWFRRSQAGDVKSYKRPSASPTHGYRWRGRYPQHTLTSGLDDYPRAEPPHPGELHVDAISWVGYMAAILQQVSGFLGEEEDKQTFKEHVQAIRDSIDNLHWSSSEETFCDTTVNGDTQKLVCNKGYVSLFPFLLGLLDDEDSRIDTLLEFIRDDEEVWSPYGVRSLSRKNSLYASGENYWRSPIWVNINYLIVARLLELAQSRSGHRQKARKIYNELRRNIVTTVFESWRATGFAWEQYNPDSGAGQRTQHFTGWTALVVKIMALPDLDSDVQVWDLGHRGDWWNRMQAVLALGILFVVALLMRKKAAKVFRMAVG
ncbi:MAG: Processing alpha glucosidase I [Bogoriella megaspora]|nr:MAG: Processing alpha glucosidase I [Bogoriella megaspora]